MAQIRLLIIFISEMQDIVSQMILKWARFGSDAAINVADDFTRLTLDSIALCVTLLFCFFKWTSLIDYCFASCAMGVRFNSFYHEHQHPFVDAMSGMLAESFARSRRPSFASFAYQKQQQKYNSDITELETVSRELLESRRRNPTDKKDLLNSMVLSRDPKTGERLDDDAIIRNMITFLIAGMALPVS
jgi:cytochrome P450/NADPH-cytochrome P450 reductase